MNYTENAALFKALSDATRLKIIDMLSCGEMCACKILESFNITQPTLSYHMKILCDNDLVTCNRQGAWMHYTLNVDKCKQLNTFLSNITAEKTNCICNSSDTTICE